MIFWKVNQFIAACFLLFIAFWINSNFVVCQTKKRSPKPRANGYQLSKDDEIFLEDLEKRAFLYFWEHSDEKTGLTLDRARTTGEALPPGTNHYNVASIAATGFALTSYCIAAERSWRPPAELKKRALATLDFFANRAFHKNGWFYHWLDKNSGERRWQSEISSIDTALLLGGVLTVKQCFRGNQEIVRLASKIYERIDFAWMLDGDPFLLSHGWRPETGFIKERWDDYSEHTIIYLLGIGSSTHSLPWQSWYAWQREYVSFGNYRYLASVAPLFIHQFSHAFVDFRDKRERYKNYSTDYFQNSVAATRAQRQFFIEVLSRDFPFYSINLWGLTASDSQNGYLAWGAPPREAAIDGTIVPCAPAGSLMFTPDISLPALKTMKKTFGSKIYGSYGFADAFNPHNDWINPDVIGIDVGITLLSAENLRTKKVWQWFMRNPEIKTALQKAQIR